jgi:hypothetical protein
MGAKTIRAILIQSGTTGMVDEIEATLKAFRRIVGGHFKAVYSADHCVAFWINNKGKLRGLPVNELATVLWWQSNPAATGRDALFGPVLITGVTGAVTVSVPTGMVWHWKRCRKLFE